MYALWTHTPGMGLNDKDDSKEGIEKYLKRNPRSCFVAKENGVIIGVIVSGHDGIRGYIYHTAVAVEQRNKGIGNALVHCALAVLKNEGIHKVACVVFSKNEIGNHFWNHCGFEVRDDLKYYNKSMTYLEGIDT